MTTVIKTVKDLQKWREDIKSHSLGFVPTMGALHDGHMSLMRRAKDKCDIALASIFVNPKQFGKNEDLSSYPRNFDQDYQMLKNDGIDAVFLPESHEIYPDDFRTNIHVEGLADILCGKDRPGHFEGVATIITIFLNIIKPDVSFFGEKDAQQFIILSRLHDDLYLPGRLESVPTLREDDGLAMSSRNLYLSPEQRGAAPALYNEMNNLKDNILTRMEQKSAINLEQLLSQAKELILKAGFDEIDYLEVRNRKDLKSAIDVQQELTNKNIEEFKIFAAAKLGKTRLIDNIEIV